MKGPPGVNQIILKICNAEWRPWQVLSVCALGNDTIITGSYDNSARMWDVKSGKEKSVFIGAYANAHELVPWSSRPLRSSLSYDSLCYASESNRLIHQLLGQLSQALPASVVSSVSFLVCRERALAQATRPVRRACRTTSARSLGGVC